MLLRELLRQLAALPVHVGEAFLEGVELGPVVGFVHG
jgi:hypothetical protein